jgi:hypothetical protein
VEALEGLVKHYESQLTDCSEKEKVRAVLMKVFDLFNTFPPSQKPFGENGGLSIEQLREAVRIRDYEITLIREVLDRIRQYFDSTGKVRIIGTGKLVILLWSNWGIILQY